MVNSTLHYITATCTIRKNCVYKDDRLVFESAEEKVSDFLTGVYNFISPSYPKFYKMDNLSKLGWLGAELLLSGFDKTRYKPDEVGIVLANSNSSLDNDRRYFETVSDYPSPSLFVYTLPNIVIGEICIRHGFQGENAFFVFEQFEIPFIAGYVRNILDNEDLKVCICGWVEVLGNDYEAVLYLVEKNAGNNPFNTETMKAAYGTKKIN
jgi:hypothetical protein